VRAVTLRGHRHADRDFLASRGDFGGYGQCNIKISAMKRFIVIQADAYLIVKE
jgi:hypothetical protein